MDLSKTAKRNRDAVEAELQRLEIILDELAEIQTRVGAACKVWPETGRTLSPAAAKLQKVEALLKEWQARTSNRWKSGYTKKWSEI